MSARPGGESNRLMGLVIVVFLLFLTIIYLVIATPTIGGTANAINQTDNGAIQQQGLNGQLNFTLDVALLYAPLLFGFAAILYAYALVSGRGSFRGGRFR